MITKLFVTLWQMIRETFIFAICRLLRYQGMKTMTVFFASLSTCKGQLIQTAIEEMTSLFLRKRYLEKQSMSELWTTFLYSEMSRTRRTQKKLLTVFSHEDLKEESWWVRLSTKRQFKLHRKYLLWQSRPKKTKEALQFKREEEKQLSYN